MRNSASTPASTGWSNRSTSGSPPTTAKTPGRSWRRSSKNCTTFGSSCSFPTGAVRPCSRGGWRATSRPIAAPTRHRVVLFRGRDEYVERLKRLEPQIELTVGLYLEAAENGLLLCGPAAARRHLFPRSHPSAVFRNGTRRAGGGLGGQRLDHRGRRHVHGIAAPAERLLHGRRHRREPAAIRPLPDAERRFLPAAGTTGRARPPHVAATRGHSAAVQPIRRAGRLSDGRRPRPLPAAVDGLPANRLSRPRQRADAGLALQACPCRTWTGSTGNFSM